VSVKKVNILSVELDEPLDETGFRHVATSVRLRLGAPRIGASLPAAQPRRLGRARAFPIDDWSAGQFLLPEQRALADPKWAGRG
jgi:hypothetical protein